jgi:hypothetical protein
LGRSCWQRNRSRRHARGTACGTLISGGWGCVSVEVCVCLTRGCCTCCMLLAPSSWHNYVCLLPLLSGSPFFKRHSLLTMLVVVSACPCCTCFAMEVVHGDVGGRVCQFTTQSFFISTHCACICLPFTCLLHMPVSPALACRRCRAQKRRARKIQLYVVDRVWEIVLTPLCIGCVRSNRDFLCCICLQASC